MCILVLESSTSSAKAMLYDKDRGVVDMLSESYAPDTYDIGEIGAQNPEEIFLQTARVGKRLAAGRKIDAVIPGGTWHNVLVTDADVRPLTPAYTWTYNGAAWVASRLRADKAFCKSFYQRTGCMVHAIYPIFKLLALKEKGMDLSGKMFCSQSSYNVFRLTGERVTTDSTASGEGLLNVHTRQWDPDALALLGIVPEQLFRLTTYRETFPLSEEGARLLGIPAGVPVLPNYPDGALNQVGAGALTPGVMTFSVGTSGALRLSTARPVLPEEPSTWCYLSPNSWLSGAATSGACNCLDWCKEQFFPADMSYNQIEQADVDLEKMPFFFPFLFGERCPGWNDEWQGGFFRLRADHSAAALYRSVQEGILFNLYQCYNILCSENGIPAEVRLSGGITNSKLWQQMCCDIFGRDIVCSDVPHASMLGGAVLALEVLGGIDKIENFKVGTMERLTPDPQMHALYEKRYSIYLERYRQGNF